VRIYAVGGDFKVWLNGETDPTLECTDFDPIAQGGIRLFNNNIPVDAAADPNAASYVTGVEDAFIPTAPEDWVSVSTAEWDTSAGDTVTYKGDELLDEVSVGFDGTVFTDGIIKSHTWLGETPGWLDTTETLYTKSGIEFRVTGTEDYYALVLEEHTTTGTWEARIDKFVAGAYSTTLASQDVTSLITKDTWASLMVYAFGGSFKAWINGELKLECDDPSTSPIESGEIRLITGPVLMPVEYDYAASQSYINQEELAWQADDSADWEAQVYGSGVWTTGSNGTDLSYEGLELAEEARLELDSVIFGDGIIKSSAWLGEAPAWTEQPPRQTKPSKTGIEFRVTGADDYYALVVEEYTTGAWEARLDKFVAGAYSTTLASMPLDDVGVFINEEAWTQFMIYAEGGILKAWIEDTLVLECVDGDPIGQGSIRLVLAPALLPTVFDAAAVQDYYEEISAWQADDSADWAAQPYGSGSWSTSPDLISYEGLEIKEVSTEVQGIIFGDGNIRSNVWIGGSVASMDENKCLEAGMEFRIDGDDHYALVVEEYTTGEWAARIDKVIAGSVYTTLAYTILPADIVEENAWAFLRVHTAGGNIEAWVNDVHVLECTDADPIVQGGIKLFTGPALLPAAFSEADLSGRITRVEPWGPDEAADWIPEVENEHFTIEGDGSQVMYLGLENEDVKLEAQNTVFSDGVIEFDAFIGESQHSKVGIEFRAASDSDYYKFFVEEKWGGEGWQAKLFKVVGGEYSTLAEADVSLAENLWWHFRVSAIGGTLKISIGDEMIFDFNDPGEVIETGAIRLFTGHIAPVAFDEIKV
ncbi:MAG: family 16 glycoside hydrolase, partial [Candidatus Omnitrophota bacterium]